MAKPIAVPRAGFFVEGEALKRSCTGRTENFGNTAIVEECDDANMDDTDDCVAGCLVATCGDGFVQDGVEACDEDSDLCTECECGDAELTITIPFTDTAGWLADGCCNEADYRVADGLDSTLTATFDDPLPEGTVATSVTVDAGIRHACNADVDAMDFGLNAMSIGLWSSSDGPHCNCANPAVGSASFDGLGAYIVGGENTLEIVHNATGSCNEAITTVPGEAEGTAFTVTIGYTCG